MRFSDTKPLRTFAEIALKAEVAQVRVTVWPAAKRPAKPALGFSDRTFVDAGMAGSHQAVLGEFPVLVAIGAEPLTAVIAILIGVAHCDPVSCEGPELLDQAVLQFLIPLAGQEGFGFGTVCNEFNAVAPPRVQGIGESDFRGIAGIPAIFRKADLFDGALLRERGKGGTRQLLAPLVVETTFSYVHSQGGLKLKIEVGNVEQSRPQTASWIPPRFWSAGTAQQSRISPSSIAAVGSFT